MTPQFDLFISHHSSDKVWTRTLISKLNASLRGDRKLSVFFDEESIGGGESISAAIAKGLERSKHILLVMSPEWVRSRWCFLEQDVASWNDPDARQRRIIPLLLRRCQIPYLIRRLRYVDFTGRNSVLSYRQLVATIRGLFRLEAFNDLVHKQREDILNSPLVPWVESSPAVALLWPELFVVPRVRTTKRHICTLPLTRWLQDYQWDTNVALIGPPGSGKSTTLRYLFLHLNGGKLVHVGKRALLTTAKDLSGYIGGRKCDVLSYLAKKNGVEFLRRERGAPSLVFLVDSLDEASDMNAAIALGAAVEINEAGNPLWLASRPEAFRHEIGSRPALALSFHETLELCEWDIAKDSLPFVRRFARHIKKPELYSRALALRKRVPEANLILRNPFRLSLLLYLLAEDAPVSRLDATNVYSLYRAFYRHWLAREQDRGTASFSADGVVSFHREVARALYAYGDRIDLQTQLHTKISRRRLTQLRRDSGFAGLLVWDVLDRGGMTVIGFLHETLLEFMVAEAALEAFATGGKTLKQTLSEVFRYEVNHFVRSAFTSMSRSRCAAVVATLSREYYSLAKETAANSKRNPRRKKQTERIKEQILYYLGRVPSTHSPKVLRFAYDREASALLRRSAAISAILHGDEHVEKNYLDQLIPDSPLDIENRSVQLSYFGDVPDVLDEYTDDGRADWSRTRAAIYARLKAASLRELRLRWWDLRTLRLFYASKNFRDRPTRNELVIISKTTRSGSGISDAKTVSIALEAKMLLSSFKKARLAKTAERRSS